MVAACKNSRVFMYKFTANQKFSKTIIAKHISMLIEVNPLTVLLSNRSRFMFLKDLNCLISIIVVSVKRS